MGAIVLVDVDTPQSNKPKKERERIELIESRPRDEWFQQATDPSGRPIWFLRIQVTGLRTRRYGPFPTKRRALLFLDRILDLLGDGLCEAMDCLSAYQVKSSQFTNRPGHYPIIEDELSASNLEKER